MALILVNSCTARNTCWLHVASRCFLVKHYFWEPPEKARLSAEGGEASQFNLLLLIHAFLCVLKQITNPPWAGWAPSRTSMSIVAMERALDMQLRAGQHSGSVRVQAGGLNAWGEKCCMCTICTRYGITHTCKVDVFFQNKAVLTFV